MEIQRNVADQRVWLMAFNSTTGAPVNDDEANITAVISIDDAADAALDDNGANPTPGGDTTRPGEYYYVLSAAESNANTHINVKAVSATANVVVLTMGGDRIEVRDASLFSLTLAAIKAQLVAALATDNYAEPGVGAPAATTNLAAKIGYLYKFMRNRVTSSPTTITVYNDDATTAAQQSTHSDDGTYDRGEFGSA
jgi:hypothetical protein